MKKILKNLPIVIIGTMSFTVVTLMDLVLILFMLLIKAIRLMFIGLMAAFDPDNDTNECINEVKSMTNLAVNFRYKWLIDLMYPVVEDEDFEEYDDEDEES